MIKHTVRDVPVCLRPQKKKETSKKEKNNKKKQLFTDRRTTQNYSSEPHNIK